MPRNRNRTSRRCPDPPATADLSRRRASRRACLIHRLADSPNGQRSRNRSSHGQIDCGGAEGSDIVTATRCKDGGGFDGYNLLKYVANSLLQKAIGALHWTESTDLTYGLRVWRTKVLRNRDWREYRLPFLRERLLRPLLRGARAMEILVFWRALGRAAGRHRLRSLARL